MYSSDFTIKESIADFRQYEISNKLDMILSKMDEIIENQHQMILNESINRSKQEELVNRQKQIISHLADVEQNVQLAKDYANIGAGYSAATAYFCFSQCLNR